MGDREFARPAASRGSHSASDCRRHPGLSCTSPAGRGHRSDAGSALRLSCGGSFIPDSRLLNCAYFLRALNTHTIYSEALAAVLNTTPFAQPAICLIQENKP